MTELEESGMQLFHTTVRTPLDCGSSQEAGGHVLLANMVTQERTFTICMGMACTHGAHIVPAIMTCLVSPYKTSKGWRILCHPFTLRLRGVI